MLGNPFPASSAGAPGAAVDPTVSAAVRSASVASGTQFELMMASARLESGYRADAKATTSSATGLFQFTEQTWLSTIRRHGAEHGLGSEAAAIIERDGRLATADATTRRHILDLRKNPRISAAMAGDHLRDLSDQLHAGLGRPATAGEIYLGYFLGIHGAKQMLSAPKQTIAASVLPEAARANATLFYAKDGTPLTADQFLKNIQKRVGNAMANVGPVPANDSMTLAERGTAGKSPDAPEAGASGWGVGMPTQIKSVGEQLELSSLAELLLNVRRSDAAVKNRLGLRQPEMPAAMLTALQMNGS